MKQYRYNGKVITASSKKEAIKSIVASMYKGLKILDIYKPFKNLYFNKRIPNLPSTIPQNLYHFALVFKVRSGMDIKVAIRKASGCLKQDSRIAAYEDDNNKVYKFNNNTLVCLWALKSEKYDYDKEFKIKENLELELEFLEKLQKDLSEFFYDFRLYITE